MFTIIVTTVRTDLTSLKEQLGNENVVVGNNGQILVNLKQKMSNNDSGTFYKNR